ncbi:hypothetical protein G6F57_005123 [Rhizopus arrhizus]|nr:hypothetical protein G6F23_001094 [Rhizopus arrhizus]KAG1425556.1 hypothetical protein G6F58_001876 [Rhizopus delemar]KAG0766138.1 hypothetical protein G6F24_003850 [Rhizopus arrhizus]KAG0791718.1 hypothetical protein G6F21_004877 [Rhizopus arrhizus]KAG0802107.1 hypothetical protein G6F22_000587 [Rhizopus arrhizus]
MSFGPSLGFGEAKAAQSTCDKYILCHDLTHLATFAKDTIDENKSNASLSFQIHAHMTFPRSIEELVTFINMKNLKMLLKITETFW